MPFSSSVPAFLSPHARSAFRVGPRPVGRRSSAAAVLASIVAIAAASLTAPASGSMVVTVEDTAQGLKFSYAGSLNILPAASFDAGNSTSITGDGSTLDQFYSATALLGYVSIGTNYTHLAPDGFFSNDFSATFTPRGSNTSAAFGLRAGLGGMLIMLPPDYASGDPIDGYGTILGKTIASTGFYDQVFTITGDSSAAGETITLQAAPVPEPSTWALGAFALACGGWQLTRRRRALCLKA